MVQSDIFDELPKQVAGMLAAGLSTYDSAVNAAAAYWVKDLYLLFINPDASPRLQVP